MGQLYRQFIERTDLDLHKWHHYFPVYETHLAAFRGRPVRMLEIGVQGGGSTRLFRDWLGSAARITAVDIDPRCRATAAMERVDVEIGDQADTAFLAELVGRHGPWDIILDDGGHTSRQVLTSFEALLPALNDGGVYIIEDTHAHFMGGAYLDHPAGKTILDLVSDCFTQMHARTGRLDLFERWHVPPPERAGRIEVPFLAENIAALHLYDSMVVIEKRLQGEPFSERRTAGAPRPTEFRFGEWARPGEVERLQSELAVIRTELAEMRASASWRLTAPLRALGRLLGRRRPASSTDEERP